MSYLIPLKYRKNKIISIEFKALSLEYSHYSIEVSTRKGLNIKSQLTEKTYIPKFLLSEDAFLEEFIENLSEAEIGIKLLQHQEDCCCEVAEFRVNFSSLSLLDKKSPVLELNSSIINLLFCYSEGYYTMKKSYFDKPKTFKKFSFFKYNEKAKELDFFLNQSSFFIKELSSIHSLFNSKISEAEVKYRDLTIKKERLQRIRSSKEEIKELESSLSSKEVMISQLKKAIQQKKSDLNIAKTVLKNNTSKYTISEDLNNRGYSSTENNQQSKMNGNYGYGLTTTTIFASVDLSSKEKDDLDKNKKKVEKFKIMMSAIKNKKIAELSYFFFNSICDRFYIIPTLGNDDSKAMHLFYERHFKELSVMTGVIAQVLNYLSFIFNVPLKYPLLLNGSKSFIVKNKEFLNLSYSYKNEENRALLFEISLSCLQMDIYEILKFLKFSNLNKSNNFFKEFVRFYEYCMDIILKNTKKDNES